MAGEGIGNVESTIVIGLDDSGAKAAESSFTSLGKTADTTQSRFAGLATGVAQGTANFGHFAQGAQAVGSIVSTIGGALGAATSQAAEYSQSIALISTLSSDAAGRSDEYREGILRVSSALGQDAVTSARAAYDAISSGIDPSQAIAFLETTSKAATAGITSVDLAGKAMTVTLNSFNLEATEATAVSDAMFATANVGVTTFDELASSFGNVAGVAAASKVSYQETLGLLGQITTKGLSTGQATTALRAALTSLSKPSKAVTAALKEQGFASVQAAIESEGLHNVLKTVRQVSEDTGIPLIKLVGSVEAVNAILSTTGPNAEATAEKLDIVANSAGQTQAAFDLISEEPAQKMAQFRSSVGALVISLGDALLPILSSILDAITPLITSFTEFVRGSIVPLGESFANLPDPIRLVLGLLLGLAGGAVALVGAIGGLAALFGPLILALGGIAGVTSLAAGGFALVGTAASAALAAVLPFIAPVAAVVAVLGLLYAASSSANAALEEQFSQLDKASAGWDEYAQASARAREQSGLLGSLGFALNDTFSELGDELTIIGDRVGKAFGAAKDAVSSAASSAAAGISSFLGFGAAAEEQTGHLQVSAQAAIDAGEAYIQFGTNVDKAVLESSEFGVKQAELNEFLRAGMITQEQYKTRLLEAANAASLAAGGARVLSVEQQRVAESATATLASIASGSVGLSETITQSAAFASVSQNLAEQIAQGSLSYEDARSALEAYKLGMDTAVADAETALTTFAEQTSGMDAAALASAGLADEVRNLAEQQAAGTITAADAQAQLQELTGTLQDAQAVAQAGFSDTLASFTGRQGQDTDVSKDDQKEIDKINDEGFGARQEIFQKMLQARVDFEAQEKTLIAEGNTSKLADLRAGYEQEIVAQKEALAQQSLNQLNALLQQGAISEQQAQLIFGSLASAFPGAELFDASAAAALNYNATLGAAFGGSAEAALQLPAAIQAADTSIAEGQAVAEEYKQASIAAYQEAAAAAGLVPPAAASAADSEITSDAAVIASHQAVTGSLTDNAAQRAALRAGEAGDATTTTDALLAEDERVKTSQVETSGVVETETGRQDAARTKMGGVSKQAADQISADHSRIQSGAALTGQVVDSSVGGLGTAYTGAAAGVKTGTDQIVSETGRANVALGGLGSDVPAKVQPATKALSDLRAESEGLADVSQNAAEARADAETQAGEAAEESAGVTVEGFQEVGDTLDETTPKARTLSREFQQFPKEVVTTFKVLGADEVQKLLASLKGDLRELAGTFAIDIRGRYSGTGGAEKHSPMAVLTDIREIYTTTADPFVLAGRYVAGDSAMSWTAGGLAVGASLDKVYTQTQQAVVLSMTSDVDEPLRLILFDPDFESQFLADALRQIGLLSEAIDAAQASADQAKDALAIPFRRMTAALDAFFAGGGFQGVLDQFRAVGIEINNPSFFDDAGLFGVQSFEQLRAQLAALAGEPEKQKELWDVAVKAIEHRWSLFYDAQLKALEAQRDVLKEQTESGEENPALDAIEQQIEALRDRNEAVTDALRSQGDEVARQFDIYRRLAGVEDDRLKALRDAEKALADFIKEQERLIRDRQRSTEDAEKEAHSLTMDLLQDEIDRRQRVYDEELRRIDQRRTLLEKEVKDNIAAEDVRHQERLAHITAEVDAEQAEIDAAQAKLDRQKTLLELLKLGSTLSDQQRDLLRDLGIDPDKIAEADRGLVETKKLLDDLNKMASDLPDKPTRGTLTDAQRRSLQEALDRGLISEDDKRIVNVALAGRSVRLDELKRIAAEAAKGLEGEAVEQESLLELAEDEIKRRELSLKIREDDNKVAREGLAEQIKLENDRFELYKVQQQARLDALKLEEEAVKENFRLFREAIADAKQAEADRHDARLKQIEEEFALELLRLGHTDDEVRAILADQADRAAKLAAEAQERFRRIIAEAQAASGEVIAVTPVPVPVPPRTPAPRPIIPTPPIGPGPPIFPRPFMNQTGGQPPELPIEPVITPDAITGFDARLGDLTHLAGVAGGDMAARLLDPTLAGMSTWLMMATEVRDVISEIKAISDPISGLLAVGSQGGRTTVNEDNSRTVNVRGDVIMLPDSEGAEAILDAIGP